MKNEGLSSRVPFGPSPNLDLFVNCAFKAMEELGEKYIYVPKFQVGIAPRVVVAAGYCVGVFVYVSV